MMPRPHIILFANTMPKMKLLSMDMWKVFTINEDKELVSHDAYELDLAQRSHEFTKNNSKIDFSDELEYKDDEIIF